MDDSEHCTRAISRCALPNSSRHFSLPSLDPLNPAFTARALVRLAVLIVFASPLLAGGCSAAAQSLAASTFSVRIVPGAHCAQRIEVHLHPARNLGRARLEVQARGWRVHPARYVFKKLSPEASARPPTPKGPYADHRYQVRTFLLEPASATPARTVQLHLHTERGNLKRDVTLDLGHCPVQGRG